jgi:hypothetical protein
VSFSDFLEAQYAYRFGFVTASSHVIRDSLKRDVRGGTQGRALARFELGDVQGVEPRILWPLRTNLVRNLEHQYHVRPVSPMRVDLILVRALSAFDGAAERRVCAGL